jgi:hypothetical protein
MREIVRIYPRGHRQSIAVRRISDLEMEKINCLFSFFQMMTREANFTPLSLNITQTNISSLLNPNKKAEGNLSSNVVLLCRHISRFIYITLQMITTLYRMIQNLRFKTSVSITSICLLALLVRWLLVLSIDYTDVDYHVYCGGWRRISAGESPYLDRVFRYPPLVALVCAADESFDVGHLSYFFPSLFGGLWRALGLVHLTTQSPAAAVASSRAAAAAAAARSAATAAALAASYIQPPDSLLETAPEERAVVFLPVGKLFLCACDALATLLLYWLLAQVSF